MVLGKREPMIVLHGPDHWANEPGMVPAAPTESAGVQSTQPLLLPAFRQVRHLPARPNPWTCRPAKLPCGKPGNAYWSCSKVHPKAENDLPPKGWKWAKAEGACKP